MNPEINPRPPIGQISVDAITLAKRLAKAEMGETVTYLEMNELIGRDVTEKAKHVLKTARNTVQHENKILFGTIQNIGIIRLTDAEIAASSHKPLRHIKRTAVRAARALSCAVGENLTPEQQRSVSAAGSILGAIALFSSTKSVRQLEAVAKPQAVPAKVEASEMAKLFTTS